MCVYIYTCMYVCMYIYIYIYRYTYAYIHTYKVKTTYWFDVFKNEVKIGSVTTPVFIIHGVCYILSECKV